MKNCFEDMNVFVCMVQDYREQAAADEKKIMGYVELGKWFGDHSSAAAYSR